MTDSYMDCSVYREHGACCCSTGVLGTCALAGPMTDKEWEPFIKALDFEEQT